jgi:hypothetical protein
MYFRCILNFLVAAGNHRVQVFGKSAQLCCFWQVFDLHHIRQEQRRITMPLDVDVG